MNGSVEYSDLGWVEEARVVGDDEVWRCAWIVGFGVGDIVCFV